MHANVHYWWQTWAKEQIKRKTATCSSTVISSDHTYGMHASTRKLITYDLVCREILNYILACRHEVMIQWHEWMFSLQVVGRSYSQVGQGLPLAAKWAAIAEQNLANDNVAHRSQPQLYIMCRRKLLAIIHHVACANQYFERASIRLWQLAVFHTNCACQM